MHAFLTWDGFILLPLYFKHKTVEINKRINSIIPYNPIIIYSSVYLCTPLYIKINPPINPYKIFRINVQIAVFFNYFIF